MSSSRRPRLIQAESLGIPAWGSLRLAPPSSRLRVLQQARAASVSDSAAEGFELSRALSDTDEVDLCLGHASRTGGVSQRAASVLSTLQGALRPSKTKVARAMFPRSVMGHSLSQSLVGRGLELRGKWVATARP